MNLQQAIQDISFPNKKKLPQKALIWVRDNWTEFAPVLDPLFGKVIEQQNVTEEEIELLFFGVHLLAEVKDYSRARLFFAMVDQDDDIDSYLETVFGDAITSNFSNFMYILSNGTSKLIEELLVSHKAGVYIKCSALDALLALYETEKIPADTINQIIPRAITQAVLLDQTSFLGDLCYNLIRYDFPQYHAEFKKLLADDKLDDMYIDPTEVSRWQLKKQYKTELERGFIKPDFNTIDELKTWATFQEKETEQYYGYDNYSHVSNYFTEPYIAAEKIGRNDPCPCGSGKKYKKCCL